jgi:hypothetical protein
MVDLDEVQLLASVGLHVLLEANELARRENRTLLLVYSSQAANLALEAMELRDYLPSPTACAGPEERTLMSPVLSLGEAAADEDGGSGGAVVDMEIVAAIAHEQRPPSFVVIARGAPVAGIANNGDYVWRLEL